MPGDSRYTARMPSSWVRWLVLASAVGIAACDDKPTPKGRATTEAARPAQSAASAGAGQRLPIMDLLGTCEVAHDGLSIDVGTLGAEAQRTFSQTLAKDVVPIRHGGGSFANITSRDVAYDFWLSEPRDELFVDVRVRGRRSGRMAAYLDGKRLGASRLRDTEVKVAQFRAKEVKLEKGRHTLSLRLSAGSANSEGPYAEFEWVRLAADQAEPSYAAPTLDDIVTDVALQKVPRQALALRGDSHINCPIWPSSDTDLRLWLGYWGKGKAHAELSVVREGRPLEVLAQRELVGGDSATWIPLQIPIGRYAGELVGLQFRVRDSSGVGRVAFAEPALVSRTKAPAPVKADTVVLVVLSGLRRASLPPWGKTAGLAGFNELVKSGTVFTEYRAPSTVPAAVLASMFSALPPRAHALEDRSARLPGGVLTLNQALKQAGGHAAMFTGVPTSFEAFGFARSWDTYETFSPVSDRAAHEPFERASQWLKEDVARGREAQRLIVIHARGAHPPWDVSQAEAQKLKPEEYNGAIDPRRGGIALANIRARTRRASRRLGNDDWTRLRALEHAALAKQDAAFHRLTETLREEGLWDRSLVVLVGDVAAGEPPEIPYPPAGPLAEDLLYLPLVVKFPGRRFSGKEVSAPTTSVDIGYTAFGAFGLDEPAQAEGHDLTRVAANDEALAGRALWASIGTEYATRLGPWILKGELGKVPTLCEFAVDPACINDILNERGFVSSALWRLTFLEERRARQALAVEREPASIDPDTAAALAVWGHL